MERGLHQSVSKGFVSFVFLLKVGIGWVKVMVFIKYSVVLGGLLLESML